MGFFLQQHAVLGEAFTPPPLKKVSKVFACAFAGVRFRGRALWRGRALLRACAFAGVRFRGRAMH